MCGSASGEPISTGAVGIDVPHESACVPWDKTAC